MSALDDLLKGTRGGSGGGGLGDLLGGILRGGSGAGGLGSRGGLAGNPMLQLLVPLVASMLMNGGLQKILSRLQAQGKGAAADSWVGKGLNQPIGADDVRQAFGKDDLDRIATQLGVSEDEAAQAVAQVLPDVVDQATPEGELPDDEALDRTFGRLHELGGAAKI